MSFVRFFDDDHECLKKVDLANSGIAVKHSQIDCCNSIEELKEARILLGNDGALTSRLINLNEVLLESGGLEP